MVLLSKMQIKKDITIKLYSLIALHIHWRSTDQENCRHDQQVRYSPICLHLKNRSNKPFQNHLA